MRKSQKINFAVLLVLLAACLYALWTTRPAPSAGQATGRGKNHNTLPAEAHLVDQSPLKTAQQLAQLATSEEEKVFAREAIRLADFEVDLAFDSALRDARLHPPTLDAEDRENEERMQNAQRQIRADQEQVKVLTAELAKAPDSKKDALQVQLDQAQADLDLDQDEFTDAKQDLIRSGADLVDRIETLKKEHEDVAHSNSGAIPTGAEPPEKLGLIHRLQQWLALRQKLQQINDARLAADARMAKLSAEHLALDAKLEAAKSAHPALARHAKKNKSAHPAPTQTQTPAPTQSLGREESAALLEKTHQISADQKTLAALDQRIESNHDLSRIYVQWADYLQGRQRAVEHRALLGVLIILIVLLLGILLSYWLDSMLKRLSMDRRQIESLRTSLRVALQVVAVLLILLAITGPPSELGTFLGLAGAGLTVALKDFIVSFLGWFVLMGKNGIRLGDWVEINGVSGEVVEIGPFHTVLMETGNWTDSGHPTGRRVTFTNNFAIEGHFFNFSTSGQWLWDELQVILPTGVDPYPLIGEIQKQVTEATSESAREAESEWRRSSTSREMSGFSLAPAINMKPVLGGIEVSVRYITRANERYLLRAKLYESAVALLGGGNVSPPPGR